MAFEKLKDEQFEYIELLRAAALEQIVSAVRNKNRTVHVRASCIPKSERSI
jgi:hypothetical protein